MTSPDHGDQTRIAQALRDVLAFADEMNIYVVSLGDRHLYDDRPTQLVAEALLHSIGEASLDCPPHSSRPTLAWAGVR